MARYCGGEISLKYSHQHHDWARRHWHKFSDTEICSYLIWDLQQLVAFFFFLQPCCVNYCRGLIELHKSTYLNRRQSSTGHLETRNGWIVPADFWGPGCSLCSPPACVYKHWNYIHEHVFTKVVSRRSWFIFYWQVS